jgi:flagellar basal-body rod protein FlgB
MADLAILRMADALARHSATRHKLIAENVANADTPGYRARDLAPFDAALPSAFDARATRPGHVGGVRERLFEARLVSDDGAQSPNGNDVALDDQLARATQAAGNHDRAVAVYAKTLDIIRAALGRGR